MVSEFIAHDFDRPIEPLSAAAGLGPLAADYKPLIKPASISKRLKRRASDPPAHG